MNSFRLMLLMFVLGLLALALARPAAGQTPVGAAFTYQGRLTESGQPAAGAYDLEFRLYDAPVNGAPVGGTVTREDVPVVDGMFTTSLDFGPAVWNGMARWLQVGVRPGASSGPFTLLDPRQPVSATPYALNAVTTDNLGHGVITADPATRSLYFWDGALQMFTLKGGHRGALNILPTGEGSLQFFGPNDSLNVDISAATSDHNSGFVGVADARGVIQASLGVYATGEGGLVTYGPGDSINVALTALDGKPENGYIAVADSRGKTQAALYTQSTGEGSLTLWGPNDSLNVDISAGSNNANRGYVGVADESGQIAAALGVHDTGEGGLTTWGPGGKVLVDVSSASDNPDHGYTGVADQTGTVRAGLYVDKNGKGVVFGDVKNFITGYPGQPGKQIVYTSLEGPEVGIYERGTVHLAGGRGAIALSTHFTALARPDSLTVQLTPASFGSKGVGYEILDRPGGREIEVRELHDGAGTYDVSYLVQAVRSGYESYQPVVGAAELQSLFARPAAAAQRPEPRVRPASAAARKTVNPPQKM